MQPEAPNVSNKMKERLSAAIIEAVFGLDTFTQKVTSKFLQRVPPRDLKEANILKRKIDIGLETYLIDYLKMGCDAFLAGVAPVTAEPQAQELSEQRDRLVSVIHAVIFDDVDLTLKTMQLHRARAGPSENIAISVAINNLLLYNIDKRIGSIADAIIAGVKRPPTPDDQMQIEETGKPEESASKRQKL